jgi:hypothetical protein
MFNLDRSISNKWILYNIAFNCGIPYGMESTSIISLYHFGIQGIACSGVLYFVQGVVVKSRGPVFVTAVSPLCTVIVAIMGYFILAEELFLGR